MSPNPTRVLFICAHNRVRSILAEALLNHLTHGRIQGLSAGIDPDPNGQPDPFALEALARAGIRTEGLRSKGLEEFSRPEAPGVDLVVTLCDTSRGELEPRWPGHPVHAHWHYADPSACTGSEEERHDAYRSALQLLGRRLEILLALPKDRLAHAFKDELPEG